MTTVCCYFAPHLVSLAFGIELAMVAESVYGGAEYLVIVIDALADVGGCCCFDGAESRYSAVDGLSPSLA